MSQSRFAGVFFAVSLLGAGTANAAQSPFPSSPSEAPAFSLPYKGMQGLHTGATAPVFPSSVSDAGPFSIPTAARDTMAERLSRTYSSVFPSSAHETGPL